MAALPAPRKDGYLFREGARIGRVWTMPFSTSNPGIHVACINHHKGKCAMWINTKDVKDMRLLYLWIWRQAEHKDAASHMAEFDKLVRR